MKTVIEWIVIAGLGLVLVGLGYFLIPRFFINQNNINNPSNKLPIEVLMKKSASFQVGEKAIHSGDFATAAEKFKESLADAENPREKAQILYKLGVALERSDTEQAIVYFKEVASDTNVGPLMRAFALQRMAMAYNRNSDKDVTKMIFTTEPYSQMFKEGNVELAYRRLYEYTLTIYPLANAELRSSVWYANKIASLKSKKNLSKEETELLSQNRALVETRISVADQSIEDLKGDVNNDFLIADALMYKAKVVGILSAAGESNFGNPEALFKNALNVSMITKADGGVRFSYADYLASRYGSARKDDVVTLMKPLYENDFNNYTGMKRVFVSEIDNKIGMRSSVVKIANVDASFKKALIGLGWHENDFKL